MLAIDADAYQIWDSWVIIWIVLWALMGAAGRRTGRYYTDVQKIAESGEGSEARSFRGSARRRAPAPTW